MVNPLLLIAFASAALTVFLILFLKPLLVRYALARPNARSSHKIPTPQGGGIAVLGATLIVVFGFLLYDIVDDLVFMRRKELAEDLIYPGIDLIVVAIAAVLLAVVGAFDDVRPLPVGQRLLVQLCAVAMVIFVTDVRIIPNMPIWLEQTFLILAGLWFVNLVNFMDGLDWMTVAEMVPITAFIASFGWLATAMMPHSMPIQVAAALCGALLGFAPFNKPVAKLFLGDVGSLSIGLLVGWMLLNLAGAVTYVPGRDTGALVAAILLPLYYLLDATITLLKRVMRGERIWEAHRSHYYQRATANGFSPLSVSAHVFCLNVVLAGLAAAVLMRPTPKIQIGSLLLGLCLVGLLLYRFSRRPSVLPA